MVVIHITFDHPDIINPNKTKAVRNLFSKQDQHEHLVFSLNRTMNPRSDFRPMKEAHGYSMNIFGLPNGILLYFWMYLASKKIERLIQSTGIRPAVIHAHKLTFEGIIANFLSKTLSLPYIITIRGNSDIKVMEFKRFYRLIYRRITAAADSVLFLTPWSIDATKQLIGSACFEKKYHLIPNMIDIHAIKMGESGSLKRFISVFHFRNIKSKNISRVVKAFELLHSEYPEYGLDIVGTGPEESKLKAIIRKSKFPEKLSLLGHIEHDQLLGLYSNYTGFILPSYPETFGFVYIEALAAGIPIIFARNSGIDGYFNNVQVGYRVNHRSVEEISNALENTIQNHETLVGNIDRMVKDNMLQQFSESSVSRRYAKILNKYDLDR